MCIDKLQQNIIEILEDLKSQDIVILDTKSNTILFDKMIITTSSSNRHGRAIATNLYKTKNKLNKSIKIEGVENGDWIIVDLEDIVVHIMQKDYRDLYDLESLWNK
ncbi:ribosome silencing factor [Candidatus Kinetoplastidibacterium galati]|uniref:Ribosomal silencing factor RsfS n=1 Tax=Candidatus Kinetoplastidibacterium galati TCC219 TaxID=1208921 RepID=M1LXW6_9PROT|nr:ribosome silencing factor [Candidatus Kinetoplastibacterium galatii]AGF48911.1 iojap-like ribosome-associated protein [Candidatus Kinetoplastibacterium galatii TCC219]